MNDASTIAAYGQRGRPPMLFLHGLRLGKAIWERHARALADRYYVVAIDLPGHGGRVEEAFDSAHVAAALDAALDACETPPLVIGYSLGGFVAVSYFSQHPATSRAMLLAGATYDFDGWKRLPFRVMAQAMGALPAPLSHSIASLSLRAVVGDEWAREIERIPFDPRVLDSTSAMAVHGMRQSDLIARYDRPLLIVNGEYDLIFRSDEARYLRNAPNARREIILGSDHAAPLRESARFTAIVRAFADEVFASEQPPSAAAGSAGR